MSARIEDVASSLLTPERLADIREDATFTRDRVGQAGSEIRERAAAVIELLDRYDALLEACIQAAGWLESEASTPSEPMTQPTEMLRVLHAAIPKGVGL